MPAVKRSSIGEEKYPKGIAVRGTELPSVVPGAVLLASLMLTVASINASPPLTSIFLILLKPAGLPYTVLASIADEERPA
ncbi:hypothetical protein D3C73_1128120 [compost metagenome]